MGISKVIKKFKALNDIFIKKSSTKANPKKIKQHTKTSSANPSCSFL